MKKLYSFTNTFEARPGGGLGQSGHDHPQDAAFIEVCALECPTYPALDFGLGKDVRG
jgi:hypothetical protein